MKDSMMTYTINAVSDVFLRKELEGFNLMPRRQDPKARDINFDSKLRKISRISYKNYLAVRIWALDPAISIMTT